MSDDEYDEPTGTLADDFLADLDELDSGDEAEADEGEQQGDAAAAAAAAQPGAGGVKSVAQLMSSSRFARIMQDVQHFRDAGADREIVGSLEEDPEYKLIVETNQMSAEMDDEVMVVHKFIRDLYAKKFPELESLILNPVDYARVVKVIGNEMDMTMVNLEEVLPSATIMVVSVTGSTTSGKPLPEDELLRVFEGCDEMVALLQSRMEMLEYVESRMMKFSPNVSVLIGTSLAAQMIGQAGGLTALSKIPSCNVQALGSNRKTLQGLANKAGSSSVNNGLISQCEIVQMAPASLKQRALRLVAGKVTLAARIDSFHQDVAGSAGQNFREDILKRIEKLQEPPPPKQQKALPIPGEGSKKKRGGKRYRKQKEQYAMTDARKLQNRVKFGHVQDDDLEGKEMGMLGLKSGNGRVRVNMESKRMMKALKKQKLRNSSSGGATSGLASSLAFTPVQGLELENPNNKPFADKSKSDSKYFSSTSGFKSVGPNARTPATEK
jgi:U4/U6 small nuclear ribonucleoprotein PRP31